MTHLCSEPGSADSENPCRLGRDRGPCGCMRYTSVFDIVPAGLILGLAGMAHGTRCATDDDALRYCSGRPCSVDFPCGEIGWLDCPVSAAGPESDDARSGGQFVLVSQDVKNCDHGASISGEGAQPVIVQNRIYFVERSSGVPTTGGLTTVTKDVLPVHGAETYWFQYTHY